MNKYIIIKRITSYILIIVLLILMLVTICACSKSIEFPSEIKIYYYNFNNATKDNLVAKQEEAGNSNSSSIFMGRHDFTQREIRNTLGFHSETIYYVRYENFTLPIQSLEGWEFIGYKCSLNFEDENYVKDNADVFAQYNATHGSGNGAPTNIDVNVIFSKSVAEIELIEDNQSRIISYDEHICVTPNGRLESKIINQGTFKFELMQLYGDDYMFEGIYDELEGGECLVNKNFEVLVDSSKILNKTLYVHKKPLIVYLLDESGNLINTLSLSLGEAMPELSINIPQNYSLVGWKLQNSDELIAIGNQYSVGYETLNLEQYADAISNGKIALVPVIKHNDVELHYGDLVIDCEYGKYLDYVPRTDDEHMVFCGWQHRNGKLFDGIITENMDIIPIWNGKSYKFNFELNGGDCGAELSRTYYRYGEEIVALPNAITREGYEFIGWFSSPEEDAIQYSNAVGVLLGDYKNFTEDNYAIQNDTVTLYAHYRKANN